MTFDYNNYNPRRLRNKSLLMAFILIVLTMLLASCGPQKAYRKAKKHWNKIETIAREYPSILDSFKITTRDTIKTTSFVDRIITKPVVDSAKVDSLVLILCAALNKPQGRPPGLGKLRLELSTLSCPEVVKDTVYFITVRNSTDSTRIPIHLSVKASKGHLDIAILSAATHFISERETTKIQFNRPPDTALKNPWFWNSLALFVIFLLLIIRSLFKR